MHQANNCGRALLIRALLTRSNGDKVASSAKRVGFPAVMAIAPTAEDVQPVLNETRDRIITGTVTVLPILALGVVAWQLWNDALGWSDVIIFLFAYASTALAITVGF